MTKQHSDIYSRVTQNIITAIEKGAGDWQMPWHRTGTGLNRPNNINTGNHYRGINILNLWVSAQAQGFSTGTWGTYKQWKEKDCQVRKGEKSSLVIFYKTDEIENADGEQETRYIARASALTIAGLRHAPRLCPRTRQIRLSEYPKTCRIYMTAS